MSWIPPVIRAWEKISSSSKILTWLYAKPYRKVLENEIRLGKISHNDTVLNIGCGAVPFTALFLATLTGARVYAMDIDHNAVLLAQKCVKKAGLDHRITVLAGNGADYFDKPFTAAIVALQASPKNKIMSVMQESAQPGTKIIFRLPSHPFKDHYDMLTIDEPATAITIQPMRTFDRSALYYKAA